METVLIVANGKENSEKFIKKLAKESDFIIGVDGGAGTLLKYGIKIDIAIGDFDSLNSTLFKKLKKENIIIKKFPREKDFSDTELAVRFACKKGFERFILTGMLGKRTDHTLFNISVMLFLLNQRKYVSIKEEREELYITRDSIEIQVSKENIISIYPVSIRAIIAKTRGLKYPLKNRTIRKDRALTLSNIAILSKISIKVKSGTVLIIREKT